MMILWNTVDVAYQVNILGNPTSAIVWQHIGLFRRRWCGGMDEKILILKARKERETKHKVKRQKGYT